VPDDGRPFATERGHEARGVVHERRQVVRPAELRLAVAAQVGRDRPVSGRGERRQLVAPRPAELGEAVQAEDEGAVRGPVGERVELDPVRGEAERLDPWPSRTTVGESSHRWPKGHLADRVACL
jgi:hypothetical protein